MGKYQVLSGLAITMTSILEPAFQSLEIYSKLYAAYGSSALDTEFDWDPSEPPDIPES